MPVSFRPCCSSVTAVLHVVGEQRIHSRDEPMTTFSKPLSDEPLAHIAVAEDRAVVALGERVDMERVGLLHLTLRLL